MKRRERKKQKGAKFSNKKGDFAELSLNTNLIPARFVTLQKHIYIFDCVTWYNVAHYFFFLE